MGMLEEIPISFDPEDVVAEFEAMTRDAERVQRETLKRILEENGETEYGLYGSCKDAFDLTQSHA